MIRRLQRAKSKIVHTGASQADSELGTGNSELVSLVVGLGNPGNAYSRHRHNVGYWTVNRLARRLGIEFTRRSGLVELGEGELDGRRVVLAKPRTMMNLSGKAVQQALKVYGLKPEQMVVVYDELDLPAGRVRIRPRGSHGGHNGMRSIVGAAGSQEFPRVRIGIGRPRLNGEPTWDPEHVADWVLAPPGPSDRATLEEAAERAADAIEAILHDGAESAMQRFNSDAQTGDLENRQRAEWRSGGPDDRAIPPAG